METIEPRCYRKNILKKRPWIDTVIVAKHLAHKQIWILYTLIHKIILVLLLTFKKISILLGIDTVERFGENMSI